MTDIISLMMVTYNRLDLTKQTIEGLKKSCANEKFNFVIVDNGSVDGTPEYLEALKNEFDNVHIHLNGENKGIARGRNKSLKIANDLNTDFFCTIDNDVLLPDGWLSECVDILKANRKYAAIGVNLEGVSYPLVTQNDKTFQCKPAGNLGTACMVFPKSTHKMVGFFNTEYSPFYGLEDSDFGMRIRALRLDLGYIKEPGIHLGEDGNDVGEYRKFKTKWHDSFVPQFKQNCYLYINRQKSIYVPYKD